MHELHEELIISALDLKQAMYLSMFINLLFPLNFLNKLCFLKFTGRQSFNNYDYMFYTNGLQCLLTITWIFDWFYYQTPLPNNRYIEAAGDVDFGPEEIFMLNVMLLIDRNFYRFDFMLAAVALLTWVKCLLQFRVTMTFGPMFKIMYKMVVDLIKFLVIWIMILLAFSCVSLLVFG